MRTCLVSGCGIHVRGCPLCTIHVDSVPVEMLAQAARHPALWLDVARYLDGLRDERRRLGVLP